MSEEKEVPELEKAEEQPEQHEHHPVKQSSGSSGAFLATLIALAAVGASYYLWQQQQVVRKDVKALEDSTNRLVDVVEQHNQQQLERIDQLALHHHPQTEQKIVQLETQIQELRGRLGQKRSEWTVAEAEYLVRIAAQRLALEQDSATAIAALRQAVVRLRQQGNPAFQPVINQIAGDIDTLTALSPPDRNAIAKQLATLIDTLPQWPFANGDQLPSSPPSSAGPATEPRAENGRLRQMLAKIWADIKGLVTIRRNDEVSRPLVDTEQRFFLQQNLRLKLESARLALLGGHNQAYYDSLKEAAEWLERYFDTADQGVSEARSALQRLAAIELDMPLPSLDKTLRLLKKVAIEAQFPPAAPVPAPVPGEPQPAGGPAPGAGITPVPQQKEAPATQEPAATQQAPAAEPAPSTTQPPATAQPPTTEQPPATKQEAVPDKAPVTEQDPASEVPVPAEKTPPAGDVPALPQGIAL